MEILNLKNGVRSLANYSKTLYLADVYAAFYSSEVSVNPLHSFSLRLSYLNLHRGIYFLTWESELRCERVDVKSALSNVLNCKKTILKKANFSFVWGLVNTFHLWDECDFRQVPMEAPSRLIWFGLILRHINHCFLLNTKSCFYIYITYMICRHILSIHTLK